jgi:hypothetical protein
LLPALLLCLARASAIELCRAAVHRPNWGNQRSIDLEVQQPQPTSWAFEPIERDVCGAWGGLEYPQQASVVRWLSSFVPANANEGFRSLFSSSSSLLSRPRPNNSIESGEPKLRNQSETFWREAMLGLFCLFD